MGAWVGDASQFDMKEGVGGVGYWTARWAGGPATASTSMACRFSPAQFEAFGNRLNIIDTLNVRMTHAAANERAILYTTESSNNGYITVMESADADCIHGPYAGPFGPLPFNSVERYCLVVLDLYGEWSGNTYATVIARGRAIPSLGYATPISAPRPIPTDVKRFLGWPHV